MKHSPWSRLRKAWKQRKAISPIVATLILIGITVSAGIFMLYTFLLINQSQTKIGYYAEVVGVTPSTNGLAGSPLIRFIYFDKNDNSSGYCNQPPQLLRGAYQIRNQTFFYFYPTIGIGNIIGRNVSATQEMYQRGAICP